MKQYHKLIAVLIFTILFTANFQVKADSWSENVTWRVRVNIPGVGDVWGYGTPWHVMLMPNPAIEGNVLQVFFGVVRDTENPDLVNWRVGAVWFNDLDPNLFPLPDQVYAVEQAVPLINNDPTDTPYDRLQCAGQTLDRDGNLFIAGGSRRETEQTTGLEYAALFKPYEGGWSLSGDMIGTGAGGTSKRWYPTTTIMPDGDILVTSGREIISGDINLSVERYSNGSPEWTIMSTHTDTYLGTNGNIYNPDYTHVFVLPDPIENKEFLMFGQMGVPVLMEEGTASTYLERWENRVTKKRPGTGNGHGVSTVLLPIPWDNYAFGYAKGTVLMVGGEHNTDTEKNIDIYDPAADAWNPSIDMGTRRHHPSTVLLPDARVAILAGHNDSSQPVNTVHYIDPLNNYALSEGTAVMEETRGYHTISLLLPDGRVLLGSGNPTGTPFFERSDFRYYEPDYIDNPNRPTFTIAVNEATNGQMFPITTSEPIISAQLISFGSMTHSFDMNQRYVQLGIISTGVNNDYDIFVPGKRSAPPGYYMMFVMDSTRIPSEAKIIKILP